MKEAEFEVLRFDNDEVLSNIEWVRVRETIEEWIKAKLPSAGEREV